MARVHSCGVAALVGVAFAAAAAAQTEKTGTDDTPESPVARKPDEKPRKPPVKYPLPMITEVHYAVCSGAEGDANGDGDRDAIGDEFVEVINPHSRAIQLKGYMLVDSDAWAKSRDSRAVKRTKDGARADEVRFVFPELELKPGQIAVVFNGYRQNVPGPVGTRERAASRNPRFHNAFVFTMNIGSKYAAFDNAGDWVMLVDPKGTPVECVGWGQPDHAPPENVRGRLAPIDIHASAQRDGLDGEFKSHEALPAPLGEMRFSPGLFELPPGGRGERGGEAAGEASAGDGSNEESESKRPRSGD